MKATEPRQKMPQRFVAAPTMGGYEVIDAETGRSMGFARETRPECNGIAQGLNAAARDPKSLARALRAS